MEEINYSELDEKCIEFVKFFNEIGLKTTMCCQGHNNGNLHKYWISFSKQVTDDNIRQFIDSFPKPFYKAIYGEQIMGKFIKIDFGVSKEGKDLARWRYEIGFSGKYKDNQILAQRDLAIFKSQDIEVIKQNIKII